MTPESITQLRDDTRQLAHETLTEDLSKLCYIVEELCDELLKHLKAVGITPG